MAVATVGPSRLLAWVVRLAGACLAAGIAIAVVVLLTSSPAVNRMDQSARAWARVPVAAREAISRDLGGQERRYAVTHAGSRVVAHGSGFSASFGRGGVTVRGASGVSLRLGLEAIGRSGSLVPLAGRSPMGKANTVSYKGSGIDEWYVNGPLGLEQGFTIDRRVGGTGELTLAVAHLFAGAHVTVAARGASLSVGPAGRMLHYSDLSVMDASGRHLPARMDISGGTILLRISDSRARYPLRIDPTVQASGALLTGASGYNQPGYFGTSVAVSEDGSTIAVGDPNHGEVDVFTAPTNGDWQNATPTAQLTVTDGANRSFGYSVAVSGNGNTIVVGAPTDPSGSYLGAAYVFSEPASGGWQSATQTAELTASDGVSNDDFGWSVAVSGTGSTAVVGAPGQIHANVLNGAAYVFSEPASGGWQSATQTAKLTAADGVTDDEFGYAVTASGDGATLVVGAPWHEVDSAAQAGSVYVFSKSTSGGWQNATQTAELTASDGYSGNLTGWSVALSNDGGTVVAGAGAEAYVFSEPTSGGWQSGTQTAKLTAPALGGVWLSVAVSDDGETVVAGSFVGAEVFNRPNSGWQDATEAAELRADYDVTGGGYGMPVGVSGDGNTVAWANPWGGNVQLFPPAPVDLSEPAVSGTPVSGDTLTDTNGTWSGNATGYRYQWEDCDSTGADCSQIAGATGQTYTLMNSDVGSTVEVKESGTNAAGGIGMPVNSAATQVVQPLAATSPPTVSGHVVQGDTLTEADAAWNAPVTGNSYEWEDCNASGDDCSPIMAPGFPFLPYGGQSYTLTRGDVGSTIVVQETASNAGGTGTPATSVATQVVQPLSATSTPVVEGRATQGQMLTDAHATWNAAVTGYAYAWDRCDASGANCSPIVGATSQSYTLTNADAGHTIEVQETASNAGGAGMPATSAATAVVVPLPPTSSTVPVISGTPIEGNVLTASLLPWTNAPSSVGYQWEDCDSTGLHCQPITGATGRTYTLAASDIGQRIVVDESATNAGGTSVPAISVATGVVPESGPVGLEINNGDYATNDPNVTIEAVWPAGTQSILISNNGGFRTDVATVSPAATIHWKLEQTGNDRLPKTVYIRFLGVGQDDINFTDDIILDETAPTIQSATISGAGAAQASAARASKLKNYALHLKARDRLVGVCEAATNHSRSSRGEVLTPLTSCKARGFLKLSRSLHLRLGSRPRYVRVRNSAGDWSRWIAVTS